MPAITGYTTAVGLDLPLPVAALYQIMTPWSWSFSAPVVRFLVSLQPLPLNPASSPLKQSKAKQSTQRPR